MHGPSNIASRVLFVAAVALAVLAVWVKLASLVGFRVMFIGTYTPSSLFQAAAIALLFVIAMELRGHRAGGTG